MATESPDPSEEFWHEPLSDDPLWRESYYFDFYDPDTDLAYFSSIGNRMNKGNMGSVVAFVWGDETYVLKDYSHPTENEAIQVGGLLYEAETPNEEWRIRHLGQINEFEPESGALRMTAEEFPSRDHPLHTLDMDLTFEGFHDPQYYDPDEEARELFDNLYHGHSDQGGIVTGEVTLGDRTVQVDGVGERDHSWGIRDWRDPDGWQWTSALFDRETAVNFWKVRRDGATAVEGYLHLDGESNHITSAAVDAEFRDDGLTQEAFEIEVTDDAGRTFSFGGSTLTVVPVDFEYAEEVTTIRRTPTRYESDGKKGYGWNEYATTLPQSEYE
jgi:hypothetical protein